MTSRDIYVKLNELTQVVELMTRIREKEQTLKKKFEEFDRLNLQERNAIESWNQELEKIMHKLDHLAL